MNPEIETNKCTIFLRNIPYAASNDDLLQHCTQFGPIQHCFIVTKPGPNGNKVSAGYGFVQYPTKDITKSASEKLNNSIFMSKKLHAEIAIRRNQDTLIPAELKKSRPGKPPFKKSIKDSRLKAHRLIIRNLPFSTTKDDLQGLFAQYGEIIEIQLPESSSGSNRGFGFIQYKSWKSAVNAVNALNEKTFLDRPIVLDFTTNKSVYEKDKQTPDPDDVVSHNYEQENDDDEQNDAESSSFRDSEEVEAPYINLDSDSEPISINDEGLSSDNIDTDNENEKEAEQSSSMRKTTKTKSSPDELEKTLFVKNLHFNTTYQDLKELFNQYGQVSYIKLVVDHAGNPRGSAFVSYQSVQDTKKCLDDYLEIPTVAVLDDISNDNDQITKSKSNDIKRTESITKEALANELDSKWLLHGRLITVLPTLSKQDAVQKDKTEAEILKAKDKRNLYLLKEGNLSTELATKTGMSPEDQKKRAKSFQERQRKVKNTIYHVSKTRLSIRNIPLVMDEKQLKALAITAVHTNDQFKHLKHKRIIKQVKIVRSKDRKDASGNYRSLGYGFVEFYDHDPALQCLRYMNNNPSIFTNIRRPIVEFSLENITILNKRDEKLHNAPSAPRNRSSSSFKHSSEKPKYLAKSKFKRGNKQRGLAKCPPRK